MKGNGIRAQIRRRRLQRWLRREAQLLAREADHFGCPHMQREVATLLAATSKVGSTYALRLA